MEVNDSKLFVGNLAWGATEEDLKQYFGQFGDIQQVEVMIDRVTGRARGFAFVTYTTAEAANLAVSNTEGKEFMGRPLKVNIARPREDRPDGERRSFGGPRGGGDRGGFRPRRSFGDNRGGGDRGGFKRRFDRDNRGGRDFGGDRGPRRDRRDRGNDDGFGDNGGGNY
jgi:RNA recognition motif-containing protein